MKIAIVWCVDNNIRYNVLTLHSIMSGYEHLNLKYDKYLLTLSNNNFIQFFNEIRDLHIIKIDDDFNTYFKNAYVQINDNPVSKFTYARFFIFKYDIFYKYDLVLYLDSDAIIQSNVINDEFNNIYNELNNQNSTLGLVQEKLPSNYNLKLLKHFCNNNGLNYKMDKYGNSGVMFVNMHNIEKYDFINLIKCTALKFPIQEQGVLNYYFNTRIGFINTKFNVFYESDPQSIIPDTSIIIKQYSSINKEQFFYNNKSNTTKNILSLLQKKIDLNIK